jgi:hypothetical protein
LKRSYGIFLTTLLTLASIALADERKDRQDHRPASSFHELRDRALVRVGDKIFLSHVDGDVFQGKIESVSWEGATLTLDNALLEKEGKLGPRTFAEAEIRRIEVEISDSLGNGALIGAGIGAGLILVPYAIDNDGDIGGDAAFLFGTAIVAGAGAGIGAGIDALMKERRLIFDAAGNESAWSLGVVPILTKDRKGIALSLSF